MGQDDGREKQAGAETSPGLDVGGDLGLGSAMRIVGGGVVDEACREKDREAVVTGGAKEGSASRESENSVAGESETQEREQEEVKRPGGGGAETAGVRDDQHEARSSRRVGIVCAPRNYKRPQSLQNLKSHAAQAASYSATISGGTSQTGTAANTPPPAIPPRSPLRPCPPPLVGTTPQATRFGISLDLAAPPPSVDEHDAQLILMPALRESFGGSLSALLATLEAEALHDKALPLPPDQEDEFILDYSDDIEEEDYDPDPSQPSSTDSFTLDIPTCPAPAGAPTPNQPAVMTKRVHALRELLSSERAYASDLALIRDIHIPLALGRSSLSYWPPLIL